MAQNVTTNESLFLTEEKKEKQKRAKLLKQALGLWTRNAEDYRNLPYRYFFCLEQKRELGLTLNKLPIEEQDWPRMPFFYILDFDSAKEWLEKKSTSEIYRVLRDINDMLDYNYAYRSVKEWIKDATFLISHTTDGKTVISDEIDDEDMTSFWR